MVKYQFLLISLLVHSLVLFSFLIQLPSFSKPLIPKPKPIFISLVPSNISIPGPLKITKSSEIPAETMSIEKKEVSVSSQPNLPPPFKKHTISKNILIPKDIPNLKKVRNQKSIQIEKVTSPKKELLKKDFKPDVHPEKGKKEVNAPSSLEEFDSLMADLNEKQTFGPENSDGGGTGGDTLSDKLDSSELATVNAQIQACWYVQPALWKDPKLQVVVRLELNESGRIRKITILNEQEGRTMKNYKGAVDSVTQALRSPECTPLKLPPHKFDKWKNFTITFKPQGIR